MKTQQENAQPMKPIIKDEIGQEQPLEVIASEIIKIAEGFDVMRKSRLTKRCVLLLLRDQTGLGIGDIERVLKACENLRWYIKN